MLSNRIDQLASPPRSVPLRVTCRAMLGRAGGMGAIFLVAGLLAMWVFIGDIRPVAEARLALSSATTQGTITHASPTNVSVNETTVYKYQFTFRTPEGTVVVTVNERDAEITVDDGKITLKAPRSDKPVEIEVAEGRHTLKVTKGGFETFTDHFTINSGGREVFDVTLWPSPETQPESEPPKPAPSEAKAQIGPVEPLPLADPAGAAWTTSRSSPKPTSPCLRNSARSASRLHGDPRGSANDHRPGRTPFSVNRPLRTWTSGLGRRGA